MAEEKQKRAARESKKDKKTVELRHAAQEPVHHAREKIFSNTHLVLLAVFVALVAVNQLMIFSVTGFAAGTGSSSVTYDDVIPKGIPAVYGNELGVSYDDISPDDPQFADQTIRKVSVYDNSISLSGDDLQRYISVASQISCEYCCGAEAIIFSNGEAACGCAHSAMMRGLAKYLVQNHPEMSDDAILEELGKWKTLFFPSLLSQKAQVLKEKGIEINYINLASNKYRGIEKGQTSGGGSMVGGC